MIQICRDVETDDTRVPCGDVGIWVLHESELWRVESNVGVRRTEAVAEVRHRGKVESSTRRLCSLLIAIGVVERHFSHLFIAISKCDENEQVAGQLTLLLPHTSKAPIGANKMPMINKVGRTVLGVRIGCQAFNLCCLNAVSVEAHQSACARIQTGKTTHSQAVSSYPSALEGLSQCRCRRRHC